MDKGIQNNNICFPRFSCQFSLEDVLVENDSIVSFFISSSFQGLPLLD